MSQSNRKKAIEAKVDNVDELLFSDQANSQNEKTQKASTKQEDGTKISFYEEKLKEFERDQYRF